ncbi:hypothetical protein ANANG_G00089150, partial [Anguilla anguilla]
LACLLPACLCACLPACLPACLLVACFSSLLCGSHQWGINRGTWGRDEAIRSSSESVKNVYC